MTPTIRRIALLLTVFLCFGVCGLLVGCHTDAPSTETSDIATEGESPTEAAPTEESTTEVTSGKETTTEETTTEETTTEKTTEVTYMTLDASYMVVYPAEAETTASALYAALVTALEARLPGIGSTPGNVDVGAPRSLLVGDVGGTVNVTVPEGCDYTIRMKGERLIIKANGDLAMDAALTYFIHRLDAEGYVFASNYVYDGQMPEKLIMVADQGAGNVGIYNIANGAISKPLRTFGMSYPGVAGLKYRVTEKYGEVILACGEGAQARIFDYKTGRIVGTYTAAQNPHSVEISPDGSIFAVASSTGNAVRFYNTDKKTNEAGYMASLTFEDAHGVLYDEANGWFWITGKKVLAAYRVAVTDGKIRIEAVEGQSYSVPKGNAHDLQPYAGDTSKLWLSTTQKVYVFDKTTGKFTTKYDHADTINVKSVKGISSFADGTFCMVYPDGEYLSWTSRSFIVSYQYTFIDHEEVRTLAFEGKHHIYKLRAFVADYAY